MKQNPGGTNSPWMPVSDQLVINRREFVMDIVIEEITNSEDVTAMFEVWKQVFEREMGITLPKEPEPGNISHWLARLKQSREVVGTLSVVDTSGRRQLHDSLGLGFDPQARVARFTHLAVLKPFRGLNIPLAIMLEAHRSVIVPGGFDYTWLLFDAGKAAGSFLARHLGFTLLPQTFVSEYGCRCPLVRDERTHEAARALRAAELYLERWNLEAAAGVLATVSGAGVGTAVSYGSDRPYPRLPPHPHR